MDAEGNVYLADSGNNTIKKWVAAGGLVNMLVSAGLTDPTGVAGRWPGQLCTSRIPATMRSSNGMRGASRWLLLVSTGLNGLGGDGGGMGKAAFTSRTRTIMPSREVTPAYLALSTTSLNEIYQAGTASVTALVLPAEYTANRYQQPALVDNYRHRRRSDRLFISIQYLGGSIACGTDHGSGSPGHGDAER